MLRIVGLASKQANTHFLVVNPH